MKVAFQSGQSVPTSQIRNPLGRDNWEVESIECGFREELPNLHARMIEQGFDGFQYTLVSKPTGRQRKDRRLVCWFGLRSKTFSSIL